MMNQYSLELERAEFHENGLASKAGWVKTYIAHPETGEFLGATMENVQIDVSVSAGAFTDAPELPAGPGLAVVRSKDGKSWEIAADYRGSTAYSTETRQSFEIDFIGELPESLTLRVPQTEFDKWDGKNWVTDTDAQKASAVKEAENQKAERLYEASEQIAALQDAADLDIATDEERSQLLEWKKYRVKLNRIEPGDAPDIDWPTQP